MAPVSFEKMNAACAGVNKFEKVADVLACAPVPLPECAPLHPGRVSISFQPLILDSTTLCKFNLCQQELHSKPVQVTLARAVGPKPFLLDEGAGIQCEMIASRFFAIRSAEWTGTLWP